MRQTCLNMVYDLAKRDKRVLFIGSDLSPGLLGDMKKEMPDRWYMEGITEANVIGMALAARIEKRDTRVIVVMGDGEINEGSVWEAALCAGKHKLNNLTAVIDYNKIQSAGPTREIQDLEPLLDKWRAFNFAAVDVDGHDVEALRKVFDRLPLATDRPSAIICHTVKGKGIAFAENDANWHHKSKIANDVVAKLYAALE